MPIQQSLYAYDDRYKRVFEAGGLNWNSPIPNPALSRLLDDLPALSNCIEFGCGEGYQARLMASQGLTVTAIDLSPAAIDKAVRETPPDYRVTFHVGDVTDAASLHLPASAFDLAVDIGCLHMMTEDRDRAGYLKMVFNVLKPGGQVFLQEGLREDGVEKEAGDTAGVAGSGNSEKPAGDPPRTIMTADGVREIRLPLLPARMLSLEGYVEALTRHGFRIVSIERTTDYHSQSKEQATAVNTEHEVVIIAAKPVLPGK
jgi:SAM-dependent methyltransferase